MAQRNSRKGKGKGNKNPELRTGGGRRAKAERSQSRQVQAERSMSAGPAVRMRPGGAGGFLFVLLIAWLAIAAFCLVALTFERWNLVSYPDSLWLYVAFGTLAVAPAVGRVARTERDADWWGAQALLVPTALFVLDAVVGPSCPTGGQCGAIGARGSLGLFWSIVLIAAFAIGAWGLARWQYRSSAAKRPQSGRVRYGITAVAMVALFVFPGLVLAAATLGGDYMLRDTPKLVPEAKQEVADDCFGLVDAPDLAVRAAPDGYNPDWTTFAVRRANESRPGVSAGGSTPADEAKNAAVAKDPKATAKEKAAAKAAAEAKPTTRPLPTDWVALGYVHPYEATVSFNVNGDVVSVTCRRIGPDTGNAVADDLVQPEPDSNPLSPKTTGSQFLPRFFTQGVAGPTEEGTKKLAEEKKAAAAKAKADAAKEKADAAKADASKADASKDDARK